MRLQRLRDLRHDEAPQDLPPAGGEAGGAALRAHTGRLCRPRRARRRQVRWFGPGVPGRGRPRVPHPGVRAGRPALRAHGARRPRNALRRAHGEAPVSHPAGHPGVEARQGARRRVDPRDGRGAAVAVRVARAGGGPCLLAGHALAVGAGELVPLRGDEGPAGDHRPGQVRHGAPGPDGQARLRRRRLRQDRGRAQGRLQGRHGRQAGRRARAHDRARTTALLHVQRAPAGIPCLGGGTEPVPHRLRAARRRRGLGRGQGRRLHRDAPPDSEGRRLQGPGPRHRRRGAAVRSRAQGAPQGDAPRGGRAHPHGNAHPAGRCTCPSPASGT